MPSTSLTALSDEALETTIGYHAEYGDAGILREALAERTRRVEAAYPLVKAERLRREAAALDASGDRMAEQAAQFYGKAAGRRQRGEPDLAAGYQAQADAAQQLADARYAEASGLRIQAALIKGRMARAVALAAIAQPIHA